jgi:serine/threonine protein kinase
MILDGRQQMNRESWIHGRPKTWGPAVADIHSLRCEQAVQLVAARVGAPVAEVADMLASLDAPRRYLLIELLGETQHSAVFAAVDQLLAREVALKVHKGRGPEAERKILLEARAMGRVEHPNVARMYELGEAEGRLYSTMELCESNLTGWAEGRPWVAVLDRLIEAGRGLVAVHAAGLVHGDVKPENILVKAGEAKLADFGLASPPGWSTRIAGTPGYIAPEVADGQRGPAGDVFALACAAWVCLYGSPPFGEPPSSAGVSAATLVLVSRARDGRLDGTGAARTAAPPALLAALSCALMPDPQRRPELGELLERLVAVRSAGRFGRWVLSRRLGGRRHGAANGW